MANFLGLPVSTKLMDNAHVAQGQGGGPVALAEAVRAGGGGQGGQCRVGVEGRELHVGGDGGLCVTTKNVGCLPIIRRC